MPRQLVNASLNQIVYYSKLCLCLYSPRYNERNEWVVLNENILTEWSLMSEINGNPCFTTKILNSF